MKTGKKIETLHELMEVAPDLAERVSGSNGLKCAIEKWERRQRRNRRKARK
jgi:hypothetical protein